MCNTFSSVNLSVCSPQSFVSKRGKKGLLLEWKSIFYLQPSRCDKRYKMFLQIILQAQIYYPSPCRWLMSNALFLKPCKSMSHTPSRLTFSVTETHFSGSLKTNFLDICVQSKNLKANNVFCVAYRRKRNVRAEYLTRMPVAAVGDGDSFYEIQRDFYVWPCAVVMWIYFSLWLHFFRKFFLVSELCFWEDWEFF